MHTISSGALISALKTSSPLITKWIKRYDGTLDRIRKDYGEHHFRLADVICCFRDVRNKGLYGAELRALVETDAKTRMISDHDGLYVDYVNPNILVVLTPDELTRWAEIKAYFSMACVSVGLTPSLYLERLIGHPGILQYVLIGSVEGVPVMPAWPSFAKAFATVNPPISNKKAD